MCKNCGFINSVFVSARNSPHENYMPVLRVLQQLEKHGQIELYAGDCNLEDAQYHLNQELHFTVCHYYQCRTCERFIFFGACIRGTPIFELRNSLKNENLDKRIWGKFGKYFTDKKS
jgi:hypothetical protein